MTSTLSNFIDDAREFAADDSKLLAAIDAGDIRAAHLAHLMAACPGDYETPGVDAWAAVQESGRDDGVHWIYTCDSREGALRDVLEDPGSWIPAHVVDLTTGEWFLVELTASVGQKVIGHNYAYGG